MPLRSVPSPLLWHAHRLFQTSAVCRETHYEILHVPQDASPSDVKQSFYQLSKLHHPDRNLDDPHASQRFVKISEAYATLGTPAKRARYDRDVMGIQHVRTRQTPTGSYSSYAPAGGRAPSGLSKRRTQFHGPPPSFYRSGGWGTQGAKRQAAQEGSAAGGQHTDQHNGSASGAGGGVGGMGPGQRPWDYGTDVPHFDREGHSRTHESYDRRRRSRISRDSISIGESWSMLANFFVVGGIISIGVFVPSYLVEGLGRRREKERG